MLSPFPFFWASEWSRFAAQVLTLGLLAAQQDLSVHPGAGCSACRQSMLLPIEALAGFSEATWLTFSNHLGSTLLKLPSFDTSLCPEQATPAPTTVGLAWLPALPLSLLASWPLQSLGGMSSFPHSINCRVTGEALPWRPVMMSLPNNVFANSSLTACITLF